MFLSIREMELKKLRFETSYPPGEIDFLEKQFRQTAPLEVQGTAELLGATREIRIRGRLAVRMEAECDRCLSVASFPLAMDFDLFYRPEGTGIRSEEIELDQGETEIGYYSGEGLELKDILREQVLLALPMQLTCREECKGICPVCGQDRNLVECGCVVETVDDRWSALRNYRAPGGD